MLIGCCISVQYARRYYSGPDNRARYWARILSEIIGRDYKRMDYQITGRDYIQITGPDIETDYRAGLDPR